MANADRKHHGAGVQGKGDGTGGMTETSDTLPANAVLSNRDKKQRGGGRGLDGKYVLTEQRQDTPSNRR